MNDVLTASGLIDVLRNKVAGRVVGPEDDDWDSERRAWLLMSDQDPAAVVHVTGVQDIQVVVRIARERGLEVAAQPRGHGATSGTADGAIVLRFTAMRDLAIGEDSIAVGPGVQWRDVNAVLDGSRLTALPGSSGDTSVIGYTVGGGLSWFGRKYGLAANRVRAFDMVDAKGKFLQVNADSHPDLFWAMRGGGGEFGIVTAMELELMPAARLYGGRMIWSAEHARELLRTFDRVCRLAPEELTLWAWLINLPDVEAVPAPLRGRWVAAIDAVFLNGGREEAEPFLAPFREVAEPIVDGVGEVPLRLLGTLTQEPEEPTLSLSRGGLLTEFGPAVSDALLDVVFDGPTPLKLIQVRQLGGAFARAEAGQGAAGVLDDPYLLFIGAPVRSADLQPLIQHALDSTMAALKPYLGDRLPMNLSTTDPVENFFPPATLTRLREIKAKVDPTDVMRGNNPLTRPGPRYR